MLIHRNIELRTYSLGAMLIDQIIKLMPKMKALALVKTRHQQDADDVVQDVLLKALERSGAIQSAVDNGTPLIGYVMLMVRNAAIDLHRKNKRVINDEDYIEALIDVLEGDPTRTKLLTRDLLKHLVAIGRDCSELLIERGMGVRQVDMAASRGIGQPAVNIAIAKCLEKLHESSNGAFLNKGYLQ